MLGMQRPLNQASAEPAQAQPQLKLDWGFCMLDIERPQIKTRLFAVLPSASAGSKQKGGLDLRVFNVKCDLK